ncbi:MAG: hypothetical protein AMXMBFR84_28570 [Candidatus Hydrogenedentota bacterium]
MRIGVNTVGIEPLFDQEDTYLRYVLVNMKAVQKDVDIVVFTDMTNDVHYRQWKRIAVGRDAQPTPERPAERTLDRAVKNSGVQCVYTPLRSAVGLGHIPYAAYAMDLDFMKKAHKPRFPWFRNPVRDMKKAAERAHSLIVPAEGIRRQMMQELGIPMNRVVVALPGVDAVFEKPAQSMAEPPYLLSIYNPHNPGALPMLLEAFDQLHDEFPHQLVVIGPPGSEEPEAWGPRILRIDACPPSQLAGLMQHSDAFVSTGLHGGALVSLLQAMCAGSRCIAPRIPPAEEIAGVHALYYVPGNVKSLTAVLRRVRQESEEDRRKLAEFIRRRAKEFTWENTAKRTLQALARSH